MDDYKKVFQGISKSYQVKFIFADEQITNQHILTKVANYIRESDISLFDITGWNPNVTLELGIAIGSGKKHFILFNPRLDQKMDAPSDIKGIERIHYESNLELEAKLILLIRQELPNTSDRSESAFELVKSRIIDALIARPGQNISDIAAAISEEKPLVQTIARAMVQEKLLKTTGNKRGTKYFTSATDLITVRSSVVRI